MLRKENLNLRQHWLGRYKVYLFVRKNARTVFYSNVPEMVLMCKCKHINRCKAYTFNCLPHTILERHGCLEVAWDYFGGVILLIYLHKYF